MARRFRIRELEGGLDELDELLARSGRVDRVGEDDEDTGLRALRAEDDGLLDVGRLALESQLDGDGVDLFAGDLRREG